MSIPDPWVEECVDDVDHQVHDDDGQRRDQDGALHDRQVALLDRVVGEAPDARDVEDGLREDRAAEQDAQVEAEDGDDRGDRGAQAVLEDDLPLVEALGAGGADVVLAHHVEQVRAEEARVDRRERGREDEPREQQRRGPLDGVVGERRVLARALEDRDELAEVVGEEVDRDEADPVDRRGDGQQGEAHGGSVEDRAPLDGGDDPDRDADQQPHDRAADRERGGGGEPIEQGLPDRDVVLVRVAEVEVEDQVPHVDQVLDVPRLVEPQVLPDRRDQLRRRLAAGAQDGGIGRRHHDEHQERDEADDEQQQDRPEQPSDDVGDHGSLGGAGPRRRGAGDRSRFLSVAAYFSVVNEKSGPEKYAFIAPSTSFDHRVTLSSHEYGIATAASTIILLMSAHAWLRSGPASTSEAFVMASSISLSSSRLQFTLPWVLMAAPLNVGSRSDWGSVKSLNQPTFGQIT